MSESKSIASADVLIELLRSSLPPGGAQSFGYVVLYTSFGVVRGRTGLDFMLAATTENEPEAGAPGAVITLNDVTVEHYSNHLASATFDRLYVRLSDVQGFALVGNHGQS